MNAAVSTTSGIVINLFLSSVTVTEAPAVSVVGLPPSLFTTVSASPTLLITLNSVLFAA